MKLKRNVDRFLDAIEDQNKEKLLDTLKELNAVDLEQLSNTINRFRRLLNKPEVEIEIVSNDDEEPNQEVTEEEQRELSEKYGERAKTPTSEYIKYEGIDQIWDLIMQDKKEKGWKFKGEE